MTPRRITLSRAKGWRMPPQTVKVDRSTRFGNPFTVAKARDVGYQGDDFALVKMCVDSFRTWLTQPQAQSLWVGEDADAARDAIMTGLPDLRGKNLACWCKQGWPCHADVLLCLANTPEEKPEPRRVCRWTGWSGYFHAAREFPGLTLDDYLYFASPDARRDQANAADFGGYLPLPEIPMAVTHEH